MTQEGLHRLWRDREKRHDRAGIESKSDRFTRRFIAEAAFVGFGFMNGFNAGRALGLW